MKRKDHDGCLGAKRVHQQTNLPINLAKDVSQARLDRLEIHETFIVVNWITRLHSIPEVMGGMMNFGEPYESQMRVRLRNQTLCQRASLPDPLQTCGG